MGHRSITDDTHIEDVVPIIQPGLLIHELPLNDSDQERIEWNRDSITKILTGQSNRVFAVVGPCSIHDKKSALEIADKIADIREELGDALEVAMRVYFEKPRTTIGWKWLINDPKLDESCDINLGLRTARELLLEVSRKGVPTTTEILDVITPQYIADALDWVAIGARTTESQVHRQMASGLSMPVGFKNGTDGGVDIALDAIESAAGRHSFLSVTKDGVAAIVRTKWNTWHVILRGGRDSTNYDAASIKAVQEKLRARGMNPQAMVDFSHNNTMDQHRKKDPQRQMVVGESVAELIESGSHAVHSFMMESHLHAWKYNHTPGQHDPASIPYGVSITDGCLNWKDTETLLRRLATAVRERNKK